MGSDNFDLSALEEGEAATASDARYDLTALDQTEEPDTAETLLTDDATVLVDSREQLPYPFENFGLTTRAIQLEIGDYTLEGYENRFAIERKSKKDFLSSIVEPKRTEFLNEIKHADSLKYPLAIIIEAPWSVFESGDYGRDIHYNAVVGTVEKWAEPFNIEWYFEDGRPAAEARTIRLLAEWWNSVANR